MVHGTVDIFLQILDLSLIWVLIRMVRFCSSNFNAEIPQYVMPRFAGQYFGVITVKTCRCSNLPDDIFGSGCPLRLSDWF